LVDVSAAILAGGHGERLGHDKAILELGGQTLVERMVDRLAPLCNDVMVVLRADQHLEGIIARKVTDTPPYAGVLAGIAAGLAAARHEWCIVVACDMPFVSLPLLTHMLTLTDSYDAVVPRLEVGFEPLHALYHQRCLPSLLQALAKGQQRVVSFYEPLTIRYLKLAEIIPFDPELRSFFNVNTPEDLAQAEAWLGPTSR
jgi:molybdenum cofactor guanylyltransferase